MPPVYSKQRGGSKKKALLIAVKYAELHALYPDENPQLLLIGSHKDPLRLAKLLNEKYGYDEKDIVILMDDGSHVRPTRENMINEMHKLVEDAQPNDHFVFHFSGHGWQIENTDGTEADGFDEVIWPVDVEYTPGGSEENSPSKVSNYIIDDDLKKILVDNLPSEAHLTVLFDCCHSGTGLDLPHNHSDSSLDKFWSPTEIKPPTNPISGGDESVIDVGVPKNAERGMSLDTITAMSRSSTMTINGPEVKRNVRGISRSMRMPHTITTRGALISRGPQVGERPLLNEEGKDLPHAMSWSACLDDQLGIDSELGGFLTNAFDSLLRKNDSLTNRQLHEKLNDELFRQAKEAKLYFDEHNYGKLPQPKPCLGSLRPLDEILDEPFTF